MASLQLGLVLRQSATLLACGRVLALCPAVPACFREVRPCDHDLSLKESDTLSMEPFARLITKYGGTVARGVLMGGADIIPGVSGGTVALIVGIYERLVTAISHFDLDLLRLLRQRRWSQAAVACRSAIADSVGDGDLDRVRRHDDPDALSVEHRADSLPDDGHVLWLDLCLGNPGGSDDSMCDRRANWHAVWRLRCSVPCLPGGSRDSTATEPPRRIWLSSSCQARLPSAP